MPKISMFMEMFKEHKKNKALTALTNFVIGII